jgi:hypothetical protein
LAQWEGVVTSVDDDEFTAELKDLTDSTSPAETATFSTSEISPGDLPLLEVGAIFYWTIGYRTSAGGQKSRESWIRLRRLPTWTSRQLREARQRAEEYKAFFDANDDKTRPTAT